MRISHLVNSLSELMAEVSGKGFLSDEIRPDTWPLQKKYLYPRHVHYISHLPYMFFKYTFYFMTALNLQKTVKIVQSSHLSHK